MSSNSIICCFISRSVLYKNASTKLIFLLTILSLVTFLSADVAGGFGYHTTMPTDALRDFHEISVETLKVGLPELKYSQYELGKQSRAAMDARGLISVAAPGFQAPGVLVYHSPSETENPEMMKKFKEGSLQIAMGVPWKLDEPEGMKTFRLGLFGLDKLGDITGTVNTLTSALDPILAQTGHEIPETKIAC